MVRARYLLPAIACLVLGACSSALRWAPPTHVVQSGDTVYSIAFRYGVDQRDLIGWNSLDSGGLIFVGQELRMTPPKGYSSARESSSSTAGRRRPATPTRPTSSRVPAIIASVNWRWPTGGNISSEFRSSPQTQSGVQIAGERGQAIHAAAGGEVVYAGSGLPGYGQLLIIKHSDDFLSAYGHNQALLVGEGDRVQRGQLIARMGLGPGRRPLLHFEIRRAGRPVNPQGYLPRR